MGGIVELPFGLATSPGVLPVGASRAVGNGADQPGADQPDTEHLGAEQLTTQGAVDLALDLQPAFPSVPSSGVVDRSLLAQAIAGLHGVQVVPPGLLELTAGGELAVDGAVDAHGPQFSLLDGFLDGLAEHRRTHGAAWLGVRAGVLGPVSLTLALRAAGMDVEAAMEYAAALVPVRATAVLDRLRVAVGDGVIAVVMHEPGLIGAMHPTFPLAPSQVLSLLAPVVTALDGRSGAGPLLIGAHVPGRTDWETVIGSGVSLVSAPADAGLLGWAEPLARFFSDGGRIAWGAVPVDQPLGTGEELLWRRLSALWCQLVGEGLDPLLLRSQSLTSPVDGLGHFGVSQAVRALTLVDSLSLRVRRQAIGARLSLGA
ncbi:MAG: uroporphyrinogen decarboxylase/cobalamine-independent methonine synthase family protein [Microthrixaceae bacterium]